MIKKNRNKLASPKNVTLKRMLPKLATENGERESGNECTAVTPPDNSK